MPHERDWWRLARSFDQNRGRLGKLRLTWGVRRHHDGGSAPFATRSTAQPLRARLIRRRCARILWLAVISLLVGCQSGYYWHLVQGHLALMAARQPVTEVMASARGEWYDRLALSQQLRTFARESLGMSVGDAYTSFVALETDWVVWNLVVAPQFSTQPLTWCAPVAGCNTYRGYFDKTKAQSDEARFAAQGFDVYGAGVIAYSTLGWFADPLTTPMLQGDDVRFATLLFHELTHRHIWLKGDTAFNESLATFVGDEGARRWLATQGQTATKNGPANRNSRGVILAMLYETREELAALYAMPVSAAAMAQRKTEIIAALRGRFRQLREHRPELSVWDDWFAGPLNNAQLATVHDYHTWTQAFAAVLRDCEGDMDCFWKEVNTLIRLVPKERYRVLSELNAAYQSDHLL